MEWNYTFTRFSHGCWTRYLTLRDEQELRAFEKNVARRIFEHTVDVVIVNKEELRSLHA